MNTNTADNFIFRQNKRMRLGHTTGTCAAAATKAALTMLLTQNAVDTVKILTPRGTELELTVEDGKFSSSEASCAIRK
ncbi:MAG: cobalt-precorrin-5B (C(1))-methyltransferase, partial [Methanomassiliicoccaceae archaeon]|nr:cobalt-precorrin-5B (C(1))-methyltransferase [Methanomassiliicoccaceae archaeon]